VNRTLTFGVAGLAVAAFGCSKISYDPLPPPAISGQSFDAGATLVDSPTRLQHVFRNGGDKTIHVLKVNKSCGCADALISPTTLRPSGEARLTLSVAVSPGYVDKTVSCTIETDERLPVKPTFELKCKAHDGFQGGDPEIPP
jgi:hypothetical protein